MTTYIGNSPVGAKEFATDTPIGSIMAWTKATLPVGWIECNGQTTTGYTELAAAIGANVPDLRGEFIRGYDNGKGTDSGRVLGSTQADDNKEHKHNVVQDLTSNAFGLQGYTPPAAGSTYFAIRYGGAANVATDKEGTEARPVNVALIYIIRAFNVIKESGSLITYIGKNYFTNPTFSVNQRVHVAATLGYLTYGWDRWRGSNTTPATAATVSVSGDTATITAGILQQVVEPIEGTSGKTFTLSWEGTAVVNLFTSDGGLGTTHTSPYTVTLTDTSATILDYFGFSGGTVTNPKLELGSTPTPFEYPDNGTELAKCMRYFEKTYDMATAVGTATLDGCVYEPATRNSTTTSFGHQFKVEKRVAPTVTVYSTATGTAGKVNNSGDKTAVAEQITTSRFRYLNVTGGLTGSQLNCHYTIDAEL